MNEPQVWTLIGVFAAALFAMIGLTVNLIMRVMTAELGSLRSEFRSEIASVRSEMNIRFDHLDRDVQALTQHVFGER